MASFLDAFRAGQGTVQAGVESFDRARSWSERLAEKDREIQSQKEQRDYERNKDRGMNDEEQKAFDRDGTAPARAGLKEQISAKFGQEKIDAAVNKAKSDLMKNHTEITQADIENNPSYKKANLVPGLFPTSWVNQQTKPSTGKTESPEAKEKRLDTGLVAMGKDLDPSQFRAGAFGVSKQVFDRAERLETLDNAIKTVQKGNADKRQIEEMAIGLNAMLSGSNAGAQEQVKALVPHTIWGSTKDITEWIKNNPQGRDQQEFTKRMMGTVKREKDTVDSQIKRTRFQRLSKWDHLRKESPEEWENISKSFEVDPKEYDSWKKNGYKEIHAGDETGGDAAATKYKDPVQAKKILADYKNGPQTADRYKKAQDSLNALVGK